MKSIVTVLLIALTCSANCQQPSPSSLSLENYRLMMSQTGQVGVKIDSKRYMETTKALIAYMEVASQKDKKVEKLLSELKKSRKEFKENKNEESTATFSKAKTAARRYMFQSPKIDVKNRKLYMDWVEAKYKIDEAIAKEIKKLNNSAGIKYLSNAKKIKKLLIANLKR
jgi:hypothetical protein